MVVPPDDGCAGAAFGGHRNAFIYSAASVHGLGDITYWYQHPFVRQIAALLLGLGIAVALCAFDYHVIARWSMVCYWLSLLLLLIVFLYEPRFGARRWISVGGLALQPSEFAKIATICSLVISSVALPMSCGRPIFCSGH